MTAGLSASNLANKWLDMVAGTAFTAPAGSFVVAYIGDPGASGTANTIASITRLAVTWNVAASGSKSASNSPAYSSWALASPSVITHVAFWDGSTLGNFLFSAAVTAPQVVVTGNNLVLSPLTISFSPIAA